MVHADIIVRRIMTVFIFVLYKYSYLLTYLLVFYRTGVIADRSFTLLEWGNFRPFCSCDLDLDPMTCIYELDPYPIVYILDVRK